MGGFFGLAVMLCLLKYSDAQITGWTQTAFTSVTGSGATLTATLTNKVPENSAAGVTLFSAIATPTGTSSPVLVNTITSGNTGTVFQIDAAGAVSLIAGKSLDFETTPSYTLVISSTEQGKTGAGTLTLTVNIQNVLEFGQTQYGVCMSDGATAGTTVGTYTVTDNTASTTVTYAISSGNTNTDFALSTAGVLTVAKTLAQKTTGGYTVVLGATESGSVAGAGSVSVWIAVGTCGSSALHVAATLGVTLLALVAAVFA